MHSRHSNILAHFMDNVNDESKGSIEQTENGHLTKAIFLRNYFADPDLIHNDCEIG